MKRSPHENEESRAAYPEGVATMKRKIEMWAPAVLLVIALALAWSCVMQVPKR